jgi:hypothetical protein
MYLSLNRQVSISEILAVVIAVHVTFFTVLQIVDWYNRPIPPKILIQAEAKANSAVYDCLSVLKFDGATTVQSAVDKENQIIEVKISSTQVLPFGVQSFISRRLEEIQSEYGNDVAIRVEFNTS